MKKTRKIIVNYQFLIVNSIKNCIFAKTDKKTVFLTCN